MRELLPFATVIDGVSRLARGLDWAIKQIPQNATHAPLADPLGHATAENTDLGTDSRVEYAYVVDAIPGIRQYRVQPEGGGPMISCTFLMHGVHNVYGVYDATTLVSGTHVRIMRHRQTPMEGVIIGVEPPYHSDPRLMFSDIVSQGSNTGMMLETGYATLLKMGGSNGDPLNGGLVNNGGRSPWDSLEVGEMNYSTETGLMFHLDSYMGFLRADELTGIWVFYWDGLTRIGGQHLQEITSVSTREIYDDEGEVMLYRGVAGYPWENRGMLLNPNAMQTLEQTDPTQTQLTTPYYARLEPRHDDQQAFHRFQTYEGYLGQAQKKVVSAPNLNSGYSTSVFQYGTQYQSVGLHDSQITQSGHYFVRNALGLTLAKRPIIPVPKRVRRVEDQGHTPTGDGHGNYKASSLYNEGAVLRDHKIQPTPTPAAVAAGEDTLHTAAAVLDEHAHMFNWEGLHPFYYHQGDYYIPEESAYTYVTTNQEVPTWSQLNSSSQWYLTPASTASVILDHRQINTAKIYKNTSYLTLLDDGGVLIGGGCGEEIRMVGGDIFLSCPGDVFMEAGRNIIGWAGRDACIRAWNSVDITANVADVRIKAEHNMQLLSANGGGPYGTFIENRANRVAQASCTTQYDFSAQGEGTQHTGIILMALDTEVCTLADNIYLRTCVPGREYVHAGFTGQANAPTKHGDIVLDASAGGTNGANTSSCGGDIITRSNNMRHWVCCEIAQSFNTTGAHDSSQGVNLFTQNGTTLAGNTFVDGAVVAYTDVVANGNLIASSGNVYSTTGGAVLPSTAGAGAGVAAAVSTGHSYEADLKTWADTRYADDVVAQWYKAGRPGDSDTIHSMWVSLRKDNDYYCAGFSLYESRWAQLARSNSPSSLVGVQYWTENFVKNNDIATPSSYPFPGYTRLTVAEAYKQHSFKLYDDSNQRAVNRATSSTASDYESTVSLNAPTTATIDGNYPIIGK